MGRIPKNTTLTGKHMVAIAKLGRGEKPVQIAKDMGMDVGTIYAWQKWPVFQERLTKYVDSVGRQELDRGAEDGLIELKEQVSSIVLWMTDVVLGKIALQDKHRWKMALDLLHHAGVIDQQAALRAQQNPTSLNVGSLTLDRRQQMLAVGNEELLSKFSPPPKLLRS